MNTGDTLSWKRTFSEEDIRLFAGLSGDDGAAGELNPSIAADELGVCLRCQSKQGNYGKSSYEKPFHLKLSFSTFVEGTDTWVRNRRGEFLRHAH